MPGERTKCAGCHNCARAVKRLPENSELPDRYNLPGAYKPKRGAPHVAALDGLRGVAIAGVVAFHAGFLRGGFLGVDLFFVLSGFLIAGVLLREHDATGRISLRNFWTRRARRLVPAVLVLVAVVQVWARTRALPAELPVVNGQSAAALLYASNWYNIFADIGYWSDGLSRSPLNHLWSLAIEEQFYVLFPLLFVSLLAARASGKTALTVIIALAALSLCVTPLLFAIAGANRAYFGTDARMGAILVGAALALALHNRTRAMFSASTPVGGDSSGVPLVVDTWATATLPEVVGWAVLVALWAFATTASASLYRGALALHALASGAIIASVVLAPTTLIARTLRWRPLVWLGERSYSLYLWHWPLLVLLTPAATGLKGASLVATTIAAITLATVVSYELVEAPIRYSRLRGGRLVASMGLPAACLATSALFFQPAPPPQFGNDTLFTAGRGGIHLIVVGDSWARNLGVALAEADSTHRTTIVNLGKGGCGIADAKRQRTADKGDFDTSPDCLTWHVMWPSVVQAVRPEAAILMAGTWDQALQDFDGTGAFVGACDATFRARYALQLDTAMAVLGARGAMVFIMTVRDNDARDGSGPDCMNTVLHEAVTRNAAKRVRLLDQYAQLCAAHVCADTANGVSVYDPSGHLAPAAQRRIATWVLNSVYAELAR